MLTNASNGIILGLLCKLHYPGCMQIASQLQPTSAWEHYITADDGLNREGRIYLNKAERVLHELWVSLSGTTFVNASHSLDILEIITENIASICRISIDARRDMRTGRPVWHTKPVLNL